MKKGLGLAVQPVQDSGAKLAMADAAQHVYDAALRAEGSKGFSVVYKFPKDAEQPER